MNSVSQKAELSPMSEKILRKVRQETLAQFKKRQNDRNRPKNLQPKAVQQRKFEVAKQYLSPKPRPYTADRSKSVTKRSLQAESPKKTPLTKRSATSRSAKLLSQQQLQQLAGKEIKVGIATFVVCETNTEQYKTERNLKQQKNDKQVQNNLRSPNSKPPLPKQTSSSKKQLINNNNNKLGNQQGNAQNDPLQSPQLKKEKASKQSDTYNKPKKLQQRAQSAPQNRNRSTLLKRQLNQEQVQKQQEPKQYKLKQIYPQLSPQEEKKRKLKLQLRPNFETHIKSPELKLTSGLGNSFYSESAQPVSYEEDIDTTQQIQIMHKIQKICMKDNQKNGSDGKQQQDKEYNKDSEQIDDGWVVLNKEGQSVSEKELHEFGENLQTAEEVESLLNKLKLKVDPLLINFFFKPKPEEKINDKEKSLDEESHSYFDSLSGEQINNTPGKNKSSSPPRSNKHSSPNTSFYKQSKNPDVISKIHYIDTKIRDLQLEDKGLDIAGFKPNSASRIEIANKLAKLEVEKEIILKTQPRDVIIAQALEIQEQQSILSQTFIQGNTQQLNDNQSKNEIQLERSFVSQTQSTTVSSKKYGSPSTQQLQSFVSSVKQRAISPQQQQQQQQQQQYRSPSRVSQQSRANSTLSTTPDKRTRSLEKYDTNIPIYSSGIQFLGINNIIAPDIAKQNSPFLKNNKIQEQNINNETDGFSNIQLNDEQQELEAAYQRQEKREQLQRLEEQNIAYNPTQVPEKKKKNEQQQSAQQQEESNLFPKPQQQQQQSPRSIGRGPTNIDSYDQTYDQTYAPQQIPQQQYKKRKPHHQTDTNVSSQYRTSSDVKDPNVFFSSVPLYTNIRASSQEQDPTLAKIIQQIEMKKEAARTGVPFAENKILLFEVQ